MSESQPQSGSSLAPGSRRGLANCRRSAARDAQFLHDHERGSATVPSAVGQWKRKDKSAAEQLQIKRIHIDCSTRFSSHRLSPLCGSEGTL